MAEKIKAAADELGYRPNVLARAMITGKSRIIGLVVYYLENQFYPEAVEKLSIALQENGYHVLLFMASTTVGDVEPVVQTILDYRVDGIILVSVSMSSTLADRCRERNIPVMLFNRDQPREDLLAVTSDNVAGGRLAAEMLLKGNPQRIAHLAGFDGASTQIDREAGFTAALAEAGKSVVARAVGGVPELVVHERTGFLGQSDEELAFALSRMLDHPEEARAMGARARLRIASLHPAERLARRDRLRDLFRRGPLERPVLAADRHHRP